MSCKPSLAPNASPEAFAEAMMLCLGYAPACSDACECLQDGKCFTATGKGYSTAKAKLDKLIEREGDSAVRVWLVQARTAMEHHYRLEREVCR